MMQNVLVLAFLHLLLPQNFGHWKKKLQSFKLLLRPLPTTLRNNNRGWDSPKFHLLFVDFEENSSGVIVSQIVEEFMKIIITENKTSKEIILHSIFLHGLKLPFWWLEKQIYVYFLGDISTNYLTFMLFIDVILLSYP